MPQKRAVADSPFDVESKIASEKLDNLKKEWRTDGEKVVLCNFPIEVGKIDALLKSGRYSYEHISSIAPEIEVVLPSSQPMKNGTATEKPSQPPAKRSKPSDEAAKETPASISSTSDSDKLNNQNSTKVVTFSCGSVPTNARLATLIDEIKPIMRDAVEYFNRVKVWIVLLIPKMEDGNNFGVSIQEEILGEVRSVESDAATYSEQLTKYFLSRGRMVTKVARYPHVDDYRRAIQDIDERHFINLRLVLIEMRNHYVTTHDLITKNLEKILKPRNSNMEHMY